MENLVLDRLIETTRDLQDAEDRALTYQTDYRDLKREVIELRAYVEESEEYKPLNNALTEENEEIIAQINQMAESYETLMSENISLLKQLTAITDDVDEELEALQEENMLLNETLGMADDEMERIHRIRVELMEDLEEANAEIARLNDEVYEEYNESCHEDDEIPQF